MAPAPINNTIDAECRHQREKFSYRIRADLGHWSHGAFSGRDMAFS
jgi:hypothetical protein